MSYTEIHNGKFNVLTSTTKDTLKYIKNNISPEDFMIGVYQRGIGYIHVNIDDIPKDIDLLDLDITLKNSANDDYLILKIDKNLVLIKWLEHEEIEPGDYFCNFINNKDGSYSITTSFYNGGTCLEEILEEELENVIK